MFNVYDYYGDRVFQSDDAYEVRDYLINNVDYFDDYDFLERVDDEINNYSVIDFFGTDYGLTAAEILREMRPDDYEYLVHDHFRNMVIDILNELTHGTTEVGDFTIEFADDSVEMTRIYVRKGDLTRLEDIFETREEAERACDELNLRAWHNRTMLSYFIGAENYRPTKEQIMVGL